MTSQSQAQDKIAPTGFLHVHDLPQLYTKPSAESLINALQLLQRPASNFAGHSARLNGTFRHNTIEPPGVPHYLTNIVSSSLQWLGDDERERIWELASLRLSERAGRSAAPSMTRSFEIDRELILTLHEPSLTQDNLGLKTWTSSLLLSRRLKDLSRHLPRTDCRVLELGAGTGLVGLAAALVWQKHTTEVLLTDLPEIVPNLEMNIQSNAELLRDSTSKGLRVHSRVLDWTDESDAPFDPSHAYPVILAADPIYSAEHPRILVKTVKRWLSMSSESRFIVELPLREAYKAERDDLKARLQEFMLEVEEGTETGYDDWEDANGDPAEVRCWWAVWRLRDYT